MRDTRMNVTANPFAGLDVRGPEARRLGELHEQASARVAQVREVRVQAAAAFAAVAQASEALTQALTAEAIGEKSDTVKLTAKLHEAEKAATEPWAQRIEAAERVAQQALGAYSVYAREDENVAAALHAEMLPHAYRAEAEVREAFEHLARHVEAHHVHAQRMTALARLCGHVPREELPVWSEPPSPNRLREQAARVPCVFPSRYVPAPDPDPVEAAG